MITEIWRHIAGERSCYEVSSLGKVRNTETGCVRVPVKTTRGYYVVGFKHSNKQRLKYVHDLVAKAFIGEKSPKMTVNHIDGCKTNNAASNLEYLTNTENMRHANRHGLCDNRGAKHGCAKLTENQARDILRVAGRGLSDRVVGELYGVKAETVRGIRVGKTWKHILG